MTVDEHGTGTVTGDGAAASAAQGVLAGGAQILRELLRTPRVSKTVRILLRNLDPEAAPELVRTLLFQDTVLFFDVLSASPALVNASVLGVREGFRQLRAVPEELVDRFLPKLLVDLSAAEMGSTAAVGVVTAVQLLGRVNPALVEAAAGFGEELERGFRETLEAEGSSPGALADSAVSGILAVAAVAARHADRLAEDEAAAEAVARLTAGITSLAQNHPNLMSRVVRPLWAAARDALEG